MGGWRKEGRIVPRACMVSESLGNSTWRCLRSSLGQGQRGLSLASEGAREDAQSKWSWEEGVRRPGNRALAHLQSDVCPMRLAVPFSGITGNKVELMLMVYDTNSF